MRTGGVSELRYDSCIPLPPPQRALTISVRTELYQFSVWLVVLEGLFGRFFKVIPRLNSRSGLILRLMCLS